jgi:hypothetical protein
MNKMSSTLMAGLTLMAAVSLSACQRAEGPAERAGKSIDNAAQTAGQKLENAGDKVKDAVNDAKK